MLMSFRGWGRNSCHIRVRRLLLLLLSLWLENAKTAGTSIELLGAIHPTAVVSKEEKTQNQSNLPNLSTFSGIDLQLSA